MKTPVVNYKNLKLSNITSPEYKHLLLLLGWIIYFIFYFLTETFIPADKCFPVHCFLDDLIPFCEWFIIPYTGWYLLIAFSLVYFALYNIENFKGLQKYIIFTQAVAVTIYIIFPSRQDLRPEILPRNNFLTDVVALIYSADTNTGVCPSLHVAYSLGIASAWLKEASASALAKTGIVVFVVLICLSVAFVKQHSVVDIFVAIPMCLLAEIFAFSKHYKQKLKRISV
jgi:hypothetical protein